MLYHISHCIERDGQALMSRFMFLDQILIILLEVKEDMSEPNREAKRLAEVQSCAKRFLLPDFSDALLDFLYHPAFSSRFCGN